MRGLIARALLGSVVVVVAGCGHEAVPPEVAGKAKVGSYRAETVVQVGHDYEVRSTTRVDETRERTETVDPTTGCRALTVDGVTYWEAPTNAGLGEGKRWLRWGLHEEVGEEEFVEPPEPKTTETGWGVVVSFSLTSFASYEPGPGEYLEHLRRVSGEPQLVGTEEIRGVTTTHYRTTIDRVREARLELEAEGWKPANIRRHLQQMDPQVDQVDVWVDSDGVARRSVVVQQEGHVPSTELTTTTDFFDFGIPVEIHAPPANDVVDMADWARRTDEQMQEELEDWAGSADGGIADDVLERPSTCLD